MEIRLVTFPLYVVLLVVKTRKGTPTHGRTKVQEITSTDIGAYWGNALFFGVILVDEKDTDFLTSITGLSQPPYFILPYPSNKDITLKYIFAEYWCFYVTLDIKHEASLIIYLFWNLLSREHENKWIYSRRRTKIKGIRATIRESCQIYAPPASTRQTYLE